MLSIARAKYGIRFHDVFFAADPASFQYESCLAHFSQAAAPLDGFSPCMTRIVDLSSDEGVLFAQLSSSTRYKIRRAEREGIIPFFSANPTDGDIESFCDHFDVFARQKRLPPSNRNKLFGLRQASSLILTSALDAQQSLLVSHAYIADSAGMRMRLLYSASHFRSVDDTEERNRIGRANRLLHWHDMRSAWSHGYQHYDLGGFPMNQDDPEKNAIARFKSEFGGSSVLEYNGVCSQHRLIRRSIPAIKRIFA